MTPHVDCVFYFCTIWLGLYTLIPYYLIKWNERNGKFKLGNLVNEEQIHNEKFFVFLRNVISTCIRVRFTFWDVYKLGCLKILQLASEHDTKPACCEVHFRGAVAAWDPYTDSFKLRFIFMFLLSPLSCLQVCFGFSMQLNNVDQQWNVCGATTHVSW